MVNELKKIIESLHKEGRYVEIHVQESEPVLIAYSGKDPETISNSMSFSGNIRIYENGYWSFYSFNKKDFSDLEKESNQLLKALQNSPKQKGSLKSYHKVEDSIKTKFKRDSKSYSLEEKTKLISSYNDILLSHSKITTARSMYKDILKKMYYLNSEGSVIHQEKLFTGFSVYAMARDGVNVQQAFFSNAGYGGMEMVDNFEDEVEKVAQNAVDLLSAKPIEKGSYDVILDNRIAGVFAHEAFGHLSEADFIYENPSMQEMMKMGREFGKTDLNIVDDGSLEGLAGFTPYDDEGVAAKRSYLIKDGKLNARLHSRETASKMGEELSGNARSLTPIYPPIVRMTNTFIDNGKQNKEELFEHVKDGIYCVDYIGGMTNLEMFTFTPAKAFLVKNGQVKELLRDVVLSGNVFKTLKNINGIANDLEHFGTLGGCGKGGQSGLPVTIGAPHILIKDVLIG